MEQEEPIYLYRDTAVWHEGDFAIVESVRIFGTGWNVYRATTHGGENYTKINDRMSCFTSKEAAEKWLSEYKSQNDA